MMELSFYNRLNQKINYEDQKSKEYLEHYQVLFAIKRDMQNMLNTQPRIKNAAEYGLSETILNYGLASLKKFNLHSTEDQEIFCTMVQQCIQLHEPRLTHVSVELDLKEGFPAPDLNIDFKIYATFIIDNSTHPLVLQSSLNTLGGTILIKDVQDNGHGQ
jgi:type VI secretion system lysozyme-like protein